MTNEEMIKMMLSMQSGQGGQKSAPGPTKPTTNKGGSSMESKTAMNYMKKKIESFIRKALLVAVIVIALMVTLMANTKAYTDGKNCALVVFGRQIDVPCERVDKDGNIIAAAATPEPTPEKNKIRLGKK